jgi:hypothetical protein
MELNKQCKNQLRLKHKSKLIVLNTFQIRIDKGIRQWNFSRDPILLHITQVFVLQTNCRTLASDVLKG